VPKVTFIVGLPGSGKTYLAERLLATSKMFRPSVLFDDIKHQQLPELEKAIKEGNDVFVTDPFFCYKEDIDKATAKVQEWGATVDYIFFENNPEACARNAARRKDGRVLDNFIRQASKKYQPPVGVITVKVWDGETDDQT
jgi:Ni2+-binding GTPase involved in maturation of urease and hydrogenase